MTTTNVFQGLEADSKSSSRVLRPPGGGSSNIFGDPEPVANRPAPQRQENGTFGNTPTAAAAVAPSQPTTTTPTSSHDKLFGGSDADKDTPSKSRGFNPITGEQYGSGAAGAPTNSNPSTRVRQPPGGAASKLW